MDGFIQIKKNTIILPGVKKEHLFIQISDTHIAAFDELSTEAEIVDSKNRSIDMTGAAKGFAELYNEPYNEEHNVQTWESGHKMFEYLKTRDPELFLLSGDIIENNNSAGTRFLDAALKGLNDKYLYVPGNHEGSFPGNGLMRFNKNTDGIGIYHGDDFIIAGIDDTEKDISDKQISQLTEIAYGPFPIILMAHIPIATDYNYNDLKGFGEYFSVTKTSGKNSEKLVNILSDEKSSIYAIICGHTHGYSMSQFAKDRIQYVCSQGMVGFVHEITVKGF